MTRLRWILVGLLIGAVTVLGAQSTVGVFDSLRLGASRVLISESGGALTIDGDLDVTGSISGVGGVGGTSTAFGLTIDGGGEVITTGIKGYLRIPVACTITKVTVLEISGTPVSSSIVVDVWKDTYANYPPTDGDSITASAPATLSGAIKSEDSTLTGWNKSIAAGSILGFNVDSVTDAEKVLVLIQASVP